MIFLKKIGVLLFLCLPVFAQNGDRRTAVLPGLWSQEAVSLFNTHGAFDENRGRRLVLYSPNRQVAVNVVEDKVTLRTSSRNIQTDFGELTNPEVAWAPD